MDIQIQSMTGFGRAQIETPTLRAVCEIKALNGRYFEADLRLPKFLYEIDAHHYLYLQHYVSECEGGGSNHSHQCGIGEGLFG